MVEKMIKLLILSDGKYVAIISSKDYRRCNKYSWHVHFSKGNKRKAGQPYARATINGKKVYLHRFIMDAPETMHVDHKNHCTLDCRRDNLEIVSHLENLKRRRK